MKHVNYLVEKTYLQHLEQVEPCSVDTKRIRELTFQKLGLSLAESSPGAGDPKNAIDFQQNCKKKSGFRPVKGMLWAASALAASLVLLLAMNLAFPAFAESIPVLGSLFRYLNSSRTFTSYFPEQAARLEEQLHEVTESTAIGKNDDFVFSVKECHYDGAFLYAAAEIQSPFDPEGKGISWDYQIFINGTLLDMVQPEIHLGWVPVGGNTYWNDQISVQIPLEYRPAPGEIAVKYVVTVMDITNASIESGTHGKTLAQTQVEFTAPYQPEEIREINGPVEQNGSVFRSLRISAGHLEAWVDVPGEDGEEHSSLYTLEGEVLPFTRKDSARSEFAPGMHTLSITANVPEEQIRTLVLRAMGEDVLGEWTIDLEEGTAVPSTRYQDPTGPLYWNPEAFRSSKVWAYPYYLATDEALAQVEDGYKVEFLSGAPPCYQGSMFLNLVTDQPYRELWAELQDGGVPIGLGISSPVLDDAYREQQYGLQSFFTDWERQLYQPFDQYQASDYNMLLHLPQGFKAEYEGMTILTGAERSREIDLSGLSVQTMYLAGVNPASLLPGKEYLLSLYDNKTKELVHKETITISLPTQVERTPTQVLIPFSDASGPYVLLEQEALEAKE